MPSRVVKICRNHGGSKKKAGDHLSQFPIIYLGVTEIKQSLKDDYVTLGFLEHFLGQTKWVAEDNLTIADTSVFSSLSSILAVGWDISSFPNIQRWLKQCANLPGFEENEEGAKRFGEAVRINLKTQ